MPACSQCPAPAVTHVRYSGRSLCREHFLRFFDRRAKAEVAQQGRLPEGRIAVAFSGGKDSVSLLHFLHGMTRGHPRIRLVAVTVDEGIAGYRDRALEVCRAVTDDLGVPWQTVRTQDLAGYGIDAYAAGRAGPEATGAPRPACGPCGVFRRVGINRLAREAGAAAVATGHNLDDMAQTILMNVLRGEVERLARLAPHDTDGAGVGGTLGDAGPTGAAGGARVGAAAGLVPRLVPFRSIPEKEVLLYALLNDLPIHHDEECPYAARSQRFALRDLLGDLEAKSPGTRHALLAFHDRLRPLLAQLPAVPLSACSDCGAPTSGTTCRACLWKAP